MRQYISKYYVATRLWQCSVLWHPIQRNERTMRREGIMGERRGGEGDLPVPGEFLCLCLHWFEVECTYTHDCQTNLATAWIERGSSWPPYWDADEYVIEYIKIKIKIGQCYIPVESNKLQEYAHKTHSTAQPYWPYPLSLLTLRSGSEFGSNPINSRAAELVTDLAAFSYPQRHKTTEYQNEAMVSDIQ